MARRLGPQPVTPAPAPAPAKGEFVATRTKGLQIISTLHPTDITRVMSIDTPEGYLQMDAKLAAVRNARAQWSLALSPISGPLEKAIESAKATLKHAKDAAAGVAQLDKEITDRLESIETHIKRLMADYKREEARRIEGEKQQKRLEAAKLEEEARIRAVQAAGAKTPQLKARLEQQRADLEAKAQQVSNEVELVPEPVKGASSTPRTQKKVRVADPIAFLHAVTDYEPTAGVYAMGKPPLRTTDKKGLEAFLVEVVGARLNDLFREQPGVVASWPGVEVFEDIIIAGR